MSIPVYKDQYINGEWVPSQNPGKYADVEDPNTGKVVAQVPDGAVADMEAAVKAAKAAFVPWMNTPLAERKAYLVKVMENWQKKKPKVVEWLKKELGSPNGLSQLHVYLLDMHLGIALQQVEKIAFETRTPQGALVVKEPVGVVGCITPWNYPVNQIACKIFPAMLVGCTVVLKPSEVTPINAYLVAECIHEAGLPKGVFNMVFGHGQTVGHTLSAHPDVDMISFTGSTRAGKEITRTAADTLKVVKNELGGKSAALMLEDADMKKLVPEFMTQLLENSGQKCNALTRMLVPKSKYEEVCGIAKAVADGVLVGKADDPKAQVGPVANRVQYEKIQGLIKKGIEEGARVISGGLGKPDGLEDGFFVKPTVFADVHNKMTIAQEEIFGPVLSIIPYETEQEGIDIANDTIYGLNNAVAAADPEKALAVARQLRSGTVMVNGTFGTGDAPFGGYKQSGNAREWGLTGIEDFLLVKHMQGQPTQRPPKKPKSKL
uniref:aldehyde dehydrogenase (NAD(+)) n=1 Tax=Karenia brevis TaxID=156230 RepID=A9LFJ6_KARBR|nr:NAD-dependent aldehyde dehydrogenase [Karenia brevis]